MNGTKFRLHLYHKTESTLVLPKRNELPDLGGCYRLLESVRAYEAALTRQITQQEETALLLKQAEKMLDLLPVEYKLSAELGDWFVRSVTEDIFTQREKCFSTHAMTESIQTGWMKKNGVEKYTVHHTHKNHGNNALQVQASLGVVLSRKELEEGLTKQSATLLDDLLRYLHYHLLPLFSSLCDLFD